MHTGSRYWPEPPVPSCTIAPDEDDWSLGRFRHAGQEEQAGTRATLGAATTIAAAMVDDTAIKTAIDVLFPVRRDVAIQATLAPIRMLMAVPRAGPEKALDRKDHRTVAARNPPPA